MMKCWPN